MFVRSCPKTLPHALVYAALLPPSADGTTATRVRISWKEADLLGHGLVTPDVLGYSDNGAYGLYIWSPQTPTKEPYFFNPHGFQTESHGLSHVDLSFGDGLREKTNHTFYAALSLGTLNCPSGSATDGITITGHPDIRRGPATPVSVVPKNVNLDLIPSGSYAPLHGNYIYMGLPERTLGAVTGDVRVADESADYVGIEFPHPAADGSSHYSWDGMMAEVEVRSLNNSKTQTFAHCGTVNSYGCKEMIKTVNSNSDNIQKLALNVTTFGHQFSSPTAGVSPTGGAYQYRVRIGMSLDMPSATLLGGGDHRIRLRPKSAPMLALAPPRNLSGLDMYIPHPEHGYSVL